MAEAIILHDYFRSSAAWRVRIVLALKGVDYVHARVNLLEGAHRESAYRALNPQGIVPTLEIDGLALTQSLAIIDYLDARFPEPPMVPKDPAARARVLAKALVIAADVHPINNLRVLRYVQDELGADAPARDAWIAHWIAEGFAALETMAQADGTRFLSGDAPGIADACLIPQLFNARRFHVPVDEYPTLLAIEAAAMAIEAFAATHPDRV
ncbi:maleylacetoacetate isomerase [Flavisphingomonas formosensis]|uniref:maleylacetoacetate isomerase n=1 Tax=Flavisphingomonas formosensis TaxID=861534 RepID=UPI0012FA10BD|nr:maleylacetoacetate isomerase [Sphingomonas formosensis]